MISAFIIAAMTADGCIAKDAHHPAKWTSKEDKKFFVERTEKARVMIMGSNTYETIGRPMKNRTTIVYAKNKTYPGVETTTKEPKELLLDLESRGFSEVAICGGTTIYSMFLKAKLVDTMYITLEPLLFGEGMHIVNEPLDIDLTLKSVKNLLDNVLLLEYACNYK